MEKSGKSLFKPSLYWLLVFIPVTLFLEHAMPDKQVLIFACAALSIIPAASLIVQATEQIAFRTGDAVAGLLNATFVASGRKTHWYKGVQFLTVYLIFSILFFLIPGG